MPSATLPELFRSACMTWTGRPAMLVRQGDKFVPISYSELYESVRKYAAALRHLGLERGDRVCILGENSVEWAFVDWACQGLGITVVPIFPTLPPDQIEYIATDSGAKLIACGDEALMRKATGLGAGQGIRTVLIKGEGESIDALAKMHGDSLPSQQWEAEMAKARPDDCATIIYTSGTTGQPKGAMLPHRAYTFLCHAALSQIPLDERDVFLSFLPMSHVYERFAGQVLPFSCGACVAYAKSLASLATDMQLARPTVMLCVPRFLEATMDKILEGGRKGSGLKKRIFELGLSQGIARARRKIAPLYPVTDMLVGAKIRDRVGGRMRFFVSGGAALPVHVGEFYTAMGLTILQGYGLTETCAATCVNHPDRNKLWTVGEPLAGVEVKIAQDGEILVRGQSVMLGYWNKPKETAEAIDAEGWFHTGDIGEFEGNHLKITDRKKDILVLANGKNVAPQPIENKLKASRFIQEAVVFGDGMDYCVALIVPNFDALRAELGVASEDAELAGSPEARALLKKEIDASNKTLAPFEMVKKHALLERAFSIESGELTPSLKVKRKVVRERFGDLLRELG